MFCNPIRERAEEHSAALANNEMELTLAEILEREEAVTRALDDMAVLLKQLAPHHRQLQFWIDDARSGMADALVDVRAAVRR